ncbi:hypothetical protein HMI54_014457 [Coelomomyces lativittatus]|nr:hypothetical protein HMI54_014457 [Coelomomyces lativittatus]
MQKFKRNRLMSLPANVIYFLGYDSLKDYLNSKLQSTSFSFAVPLISGASARAIAATIISPIELLRTQMQGPHASKASIIELIQRIRWQVTVHHGPTYLWRGLVPTLWRDVPFSGIYWITYEHLKTKFQVWFPMLHPVQMAFTSGALAGMLAATCTAPFDVAKTRRQLHLVSPRPWTSSTPTHPSSMFHVLKHIAYHEGVRGLFAGVVPRVAKVAPACAIMIGTYEYGKRFFGHIQTGGGEELEVGMKKKGKGESGLLDRFKEVAVNHQ